MKKIFTLLSAALLTATAWAQVPELLFQGNPIVPGQVYETGYTVEKLDLGAMAIYTYTQNSDLSLKGYLGEDVTVEVTATSDVQVCSIDGQCLSGSNVTKTGPLGTHDVISDDGEIAVVDLKIDLVTNDMTGADPSTLLHEATVKVKAYYKAIPEQYTETTVVLTTKPASEINGINDAKNDAIISLGAANTINYNASAPTRLEIYSVSGAAVLSRTINHSGSISLDMLHPGVYVYSAGNQHGKILIK